MEAGGRAEGRGRDGVDVRCVAAKHLTYTLSPLHFVPFICSQESLSLSSTEIYKSAEHVLTSMTSSICGGSLLLLLLLLWDGALQDLPFAGGIRRAHGHAAAGWRLHTVRPQR